MIKKYYAVISEPGPNSQAIRFVKRFSDLKLAAQEAKEKKAKIYEYDKPLERGEHPETRGKLIKDYSIEKI